MKLSANASSPQALIIERFKKLVQGMIETNQEMLLFEDDADKKNKYINYKNILIPTLEFLENSNTDSTEAFYDSFNTISEMISNLITKFPENPEGFEMLQKEPALFFQESFDQLKNEIFDLYPALEWWPQINDYDVFKEEKEKNTLDANIASKTPQQVVKMHLNEKSSAQLYKGANDVDDVKTARKKFLIYLEKRMHDIKQQKDKPRKTINMVTLLGKEGVKLYKAAVKEESNSKNFRDAVFLKSMNVYEGPKWKKKLLLWVGGPSSSGKTYAANEAVKMMSKKMKTKKPKVNDKNYVVSIDGGIEREMSQMRQLVLQVALLKGYKGIEDLHNNTHLNIKQYVKEAALEQEDLGLVLPETFAESATKDIFGDYLKSNEIALYQRLEGIEQAFAEVTCDNDRKVNFAISVWHMGSSRAWFPENKNFTRKDLKINNRKIGCESKIYDWAGFEIGKHASKLVRDSLKSNNPNGFYIRIINDLIFVHKNGKEWKECGYHDTPAIKISLRDFHTWQNEKLKNKATPDLDKWYENLKNNDNLAPVLISIVQNNAVLPTLEISTESKKLPSQNVNKKLIYSTKTQKTSTLVESQISSEKKENKPPGIKKN